MSDKINQHLLEVLLESWNRNNEILVNFLRVLPEDGFDVKPLEDSPSIGELYNHIHYVRLVFVAEDAPEFASALPDQEWRSEVSMARMAQNLNDSAKAVRDAVKSKVELNQDMNLHYDHPVLLLQHMLWHEGYHHGQMKLALKLAGLKIANEVAGPVTWRVWMDKK